MNGNEFVEDTIEDEVPENGYNIGSDHGYSKRRSSQDVLSLLEKDVTGSEDWKNHMQQYTEAIKYETEQGNLRNLSINAPV